MALTLVTYQDGKVVSREPFGRTARQDTELAKKRMEEKRDPPLPDAGAGTIPGWLMRPGSS